MHVTQDLYQALGGQICPHCGSKDEVWREINHHADPGIIYQLCHCYNCEGCWEEEYHLAKFNKKGTE